MTTAGSAAAEAWLDGADGAGADPWHESVDRVLVAMSMPTVDARRVLNGERSRWRERSVAARGAAGPGASEPGAVAPAQLAREARARLAASAARAEARLAEAMLAWLDEVAAAGPDGASFAPSAERPRRGRRPSAPAVAAGTPAGGPQADE
ncbi:hypothetical protein GCM10025870_02810 [Agromyces marinus]|uniref:Uncharacterized protein n=1 Tax=Agromyces marinus TaxID=1389020 RepID=A0ABM8GXJ3_9MICO|nr:hypothetical protein [Agromyces marinus]BDZ53208.1 hypothetical protein GCM10025870_02810 [Agromyces marinus]